MRILVVDDDAATRRLFSVALAGNGEIVTARNGAEALEVFKSSRNIDLVVTDLTMPGLSGIELIRNLRQLPSTVPILVLSSVHTDYSVALALESGADDYLMKPVDLRELRSAVSFLARQPRMTSLRIAPAKGQPTARDSASVRNLGEGTFVELSFAGDSLEADRFQRFAERLMTMAMTPAQRQDLKLALEEIVRNAIEWGNRNDPSKRLRLSYCLLSDRITFRVEDEGTGFDPRELKDPSRDPVAHLSDRRSAGKRIGGWGIFLARKMMDEVTFNRRGNVVFLTKHLKRTPVLLATGAGGVESLGVPPMQAKVSEQPARRPTRRIRKTSRRTRVKETRGTAAFERNEDSQGE